MLLYSYPTRGPFGSVFSELRLSWVGFGIAAAENKEACAAGCGAYSSKLLQCSRCHMVRYCGQECQKRHWKQHKKECALRLEERKKDAKGAGGAPLTWDARDRRGARYMAKKK